jgi:hypothetical protein
LALRFRAIELRPLTADESLLAAVRTAGVESGTASGAELAAGSTDGGIADAEDVSGADDDKLGSGSGGCTD